MVLENIIVALAEIQPRPLKDISERIASSKELLKMSIEQLLESGVTLGKATKLLSNNLRIRAEQECEFVFKNNISVISIYDKGYPTYLRECVDAPFLLYVKGDIDFTINCEKYLSVIGTRRSTAYGEQIGKKIISDLGTYHPDTVIVSGLSYGIDSVAHEAAITSGLKTVAVLPAGLDNIFPTSNIALSQRIVDNGGVLISEFPSNTQIYKPFFLKRNRIVAGISVGTLVVESPLNGGTMKTAEMAGSYDREVFAVPGRVSDSSYVGCNSLIKSSRAQLITSAKDIEYYLGWERSRPDISCFAPDLSGLDKIVYDCFEERGELTADEIVEGTGISLSELSLAITNLHLSNLIMPVRGNKFVKL